tara:strand:- start:150 stop:437 length:288 start_codon:yes stop_codon:yes gene_type:complete
MAKKLIKYRKQFTTHNELLFERRLLNRFVSSLEGRPFRVYEACKPKMRKGIRSWEIEPEYRLARLNLRLYGSTAGRMSSWARDYFYVGNTSLWIR